MQVQSASDPYTNASRDRDCGNYSSVLFGLFLSIGSKGMFNVLSWQSHEPTQTLLTVSLQPARRVGRRFNGNNKISLGKKKERNFPRKGPQNDDPPAKEKKREKSGYQSRRCLFVGPLRSVSVMNKSPVDSLHSIPPPPLALCALILTQTDTRKATVGTRSSYSNARRWWSALFHLSTSTSS